MFEKGADNLLMGVDKILNLMAPEDSRGIVFHVSHKAPLTTRLYKPNARLEFLGFPQIHSAHHNNKLHSFSKLKEMSCCSCCPETSESCVSHLFPQCWQVQRALYFRKKRVKYGSGRNEQGGLEA